MEYETCIQTVMSKMLVHEEPMIAINNFAYHYHRLISNSERYIEEHEISAVFDLPDEKNLDEKYEKVGEAALKKAVVIKLNGGLGTSMGLNKAKSLIKIKQEDTFLDVIAKQCLKQDTPLVLMNSYRTHSDTISHLKNYKTLELDKNLFCFRQHKVPKIGLENLLPISHKDNEQEWCPPGHGDLYPALVTSGTLDELIKQGFEYAFISNCDNLGATINKKILGYMVDNNLPFLMEVAERNLCDKKGGHLARTRTGKLILREVAQCKQSELCGFKDIDKYKYFNTNNIWINLGALKRKMQQYNNVLPLPLICNKKQIKDSRERDIAIFQLETAVGAAISLFDGAEAIIVGRERFIPVKDTTDLLRVRSNLFVLTDDATLVINPALKGGMPRITLDERYYKTLEKYEFRFKAGEPDLLGCKELVLEGDFIFGGGNRFHGMTIMRNKKAEPHFLANSMSYTGIRMWV